MAEIIPLDECVERGIYEVYSRNLLVGVYDGNGGFIGIREKFGHRYLFTEIHQEEGGRGTARPVRLLGTCPGDIPLVEYFGWDTCAEGRQTYWKPDDPTGIRVTPGARYHVDDDSRLDYGDYPVLTSNQWLMHVLEPFQAEIAEELNYP